MIEVRQKYERFIERHNGVHPQVVLAAIEWKDSAEENEYMLSLNDIWIEDTPKLCYDTDSGRINEEEIFFHLGSIGNFYDMLEKSPEDFAINRVIDFY